jgi:hypothetical protein
MLQSWISPSWMAESFTTQRLDMGVAERWFPSERRQLL